MKNLLYVFGLSLSKQKELFFIACNIQLANKIQNISQEKNLWVEVIFRWNTFMKSNTQKISFIWLFSLFVRLLKIWTRSLSFVDIHDLKGDVHTYEILTSMEWSWNLNWCLSLIEVADRWKKLFNHVSNM